MIKQQFAGKHSTPLEQSFFLLATVAQEQHASTRESRRESHLERKLARARVLLDPLIRYP